MTAVTHCGRTSLRHLYRGQVELLRDSGCALITLFVEAANEAQAYALMECYVATVLSPADCPDLHNVYTAHALIDFGTSRDELLRLFEMGWRGNEVASWVEEPIFLVRDPAALMRKYQQIPEEARHAA